MYSVIKNVQILVALLKKHKVNRVVISPGGNNIPIIHSLDTDSDFNCYSVVDERSAAYFAMGLAQECNELVALVCTSGTAVSNYLPGLTEAMYQRVPLLVITSDRSPYLLHQLETQKINQIGIFGESCKKEVNLPVVKVVDDEWYCSRLINEAIIETRHHGCGPVHINIPTVGDSADYSCKQLPNVNTITLIDYPTMMDSKVSEYANIINAAKSILLIFGENFKLQSETEIRLINEFCKKTNAVCIADYMSNVQAIPALYSYSITETITESDFEDLMPELVITFGNNILSNSLKNYLRHNRGMIQHWCVDEAGEIRDVFKSLRVVFECKNEYFFNWIIKYVKENTDRSYIERWSIAKEKSSIGDIDFSGLKAVRELVSRMPDQSLVHLAILNSTRIFHMFDNNKKFKVYSNIGALGIDGCMSTFIGQSFATDNLSFLVIGDLSFFYDMNSLGIRGLKPNVRILLLNNGGGAEFHFNMGKKNIPTLNKFISVGHIKTARGWVESLGFSYYAVKNENDLQLALNFFTKQSDRPIVVEVFTDMEKDAEVVKAVINTVRYGRSTSSKVKGALLNILKK